MMRSTRQQCQSVDSKLNLCSKWQPFKAHSKRHDNRFEYSRQLDTFINVPFEDFQGAPLSP